MKTVAREVGRDCCFEVFGCREIGVAAGSIALLELGQSAAVKGARQLRVDAQR